MDYDILTELGLTNREVRVYVALLELGTSTAGPIAVKAKLSQTKVYETLGRLQQQGLVSYTMVSKTKHFQSTNPQQLLARLDDQKRRFAVVVSELQAKQLFAKQRQVSRVHEGYNALQLLFNQIVESLDKSKKDFYYAFALKTDYRAKSAPLFFVQVHRKLAEKKIVDLAIAHNDVKKELAQTYEGNNNIQLKFSRHSHPLGLVIVPGKVIQLLWSDLPTAIEIESVQIAEQYKQFFEDEWKTI